MFTCKKKELLAMTAMNVTGKNNDANCIKTIEILMLLKFMIRLWISMY